MATEKKGILYAGLPVVAAVAVILLIVFVGKIAAALGAALYVGGWATHKHRAAVRERLQHPTAYLQNKLGSWWRA